MRLFEGTTVVVDSGNIFDTTYNGGKMGVYALSQGGIIFSDMSYRYFFRI